jgi:PAS domain S-box-containing protein
LGKINEELKKEIAQRKVTEEALRESEKKYRETIDLSPETIFETDLKGNFIFANQIGMKKFGYSEDDLKTGLNILQMIVPEEREKAISNVLRVLRGEDLASKEYTGLRKDGTVFPILIHSDQFTRDGETIGIRGIVMDLTSIKQAEKKLHESERNFRDILENSQNIVYKFNVQTNSYDYVSPSVKKVLGWTVEEYSTEKISHAVNMVHPDDFKRCKESRIKLLSATNKKEYTRELDLRLKHKNSEYRWFRDYSTVIKNSKGTPLYTISYLFDINEQKRTEEELKESEQKFRSISEQSLMGIVIVQDGVVKYTNDALSAVIGYPPEEVQNWPPNKMFDFVHPDDRKFVIEQAQKKQGGITEGTLPHYPVRFFAKSGEIRWIEITSKTITYLGKNADLVMLMDITDRKKAEDALKESGDVMRSLLENSPDFILMLDKAGIVQFINHPIPGVNPDSTDYKSIYDFINREYHEVLRNSISQVFETGKTDSIKLIIHDKKGFKISYEVRFGIIRQDWKSVGVILILTDITKREKIQAELVESENLFRKLFNDGPLGMAITDLNMNFLRVNDAYCDLFGYSHEEFHALTFKELRFPEDLKNDKANILKFIKGEVNLYQAEKRYKTKDGQSIWGKLSASTIKNEFGEVVYNLAIIEDITDKKRDKEALIASEEKYRQVVETINDGLGIVDENNCLTYVNEKFCEMLQYSISEILGRKLTDFMDENGLITFQNQIGLRQKGMHTQYENYYIKKNGEKLQAIVSPTPLFFPSGKFKGSMAIITDITERKMAEEKLKESEQQYRTTINALGEPIHVIDKSYKIILINETLTNWVEDLNLDARILGKTPKEAWSFLPDWAMKEYQSIFDNGKPILTVGSSIIDNRDITTETRKIPIFKKGKVVQIITIIRDITERKEAEQKLKDSEENYMKLFKELQKKNMEMGYILKNIPIILWSTDKEGVFTFSEGKGLTALGLKPGEIVGKSVFEFYKDFPDILENNRRALSGESLNRTTEVGDNLYESYYEPLRNEDNELIGMLGLAINISNRENLK